MLRFQIRIPDIVRHTSHVEIRVQLRQTRSLESPAVSCPDLETTRRIHHIHFRSKGTPELGIVRIPESADHLQIIENHPVDLRKQVGIVHIPGGLFLTILHFIIVLRPVPFESLNDHQIFPRLKLIYQTDSLFVRPGVRAIRNIQKVIYRLTCIKISRISTIQFIAIIKSMLGVHL